jgi:hypothetical protein
MVLVTSFQPEDFFEMTSVFRMVFVAAMLVLAPMRANADIVVSVAPVNPGPIVEGTSAVFDIFARSTTANEQFGFFAFDLVVSTPAGVALTDSRGGRFTNPATNLLGGFGWSFNNNNPAIALFDGQSSATIPGFGSNNTKIGTITLATPGATLGNYLMDFRNVVALTSGFVTIASSGQSTSFTITAVPEPSSMALLCVAGVAAWGYRRRARKN